MKKLLYASLAITMLTSCYGDDIEAGKKLFEAKCTVCHTATRPNTTEAMNSLIAPPMQGVMRHLYMRYGDDRDAMKAFIKDYTLNPSKDKALCWPEKIEKFGLMPSQKSSVTPDELDKIADYLYSAY